MPHIEFLAAPKEGGKTVAAVLRGRFGLTWARAKSLVEGGHVRVAGFACRDVGHRVRKGNRVWVREGTVEQPRTAGGTPKPAAAKAAGPAKPTPATPAAPSKPREAKPAAAVPTDFPLSPAALVYADDSVVVVNKPAGLTTQRHAGEAAEFGERGQKFLPKTLADLLPRLLGTPSRRVIPVHRIDRDTSGLVVFARTPAAAEHLSTQFRKHTADRRYRALTRGTPENGRVESVFVPDRGDGRRGSGADPAAADGKRAVTHVKVLEPLGKFALVECRLETGRTHQVRIHLGDLGTPLCGEAIYDRPLNGKRHPDGSGATRPMLHAARLGFTHPDTGEAMRWQIDPPDDFSRLLGKLRDQGGAEAWEL